MSDVTPEHEAAHAEPQTVVSPVEDMPSALPDRPNSRFSAVQGLVMERVSHPHFVRNGAITLGLLIAGAIIGILLQAGLTPADKATRLSQFQDWRVVCPPMTEKDPTNNQTLGCTLSNSIARDAGGGTLAMLSIGSTKADAKMNVIVPHGVLLDPGLMFAVAETTPQTRPYETCDNNGCVALVALDAAMLTALRSKSQGQVQVAAMGQQQPVSIPFSLAGFDEGYAALQREDSRRTGFFSFLYR